MFPGKGGIHPIDSIGRITDILGEEGAGTRLAESMGIRPAFTG